MKKLLIVLVVIIVLGAAGGGAWWYMNNQQSRPGPGELAGENNPAPTPPPVPAPDAGTDKTGDILNAVSNVKVGDPSTDFVDVNRDAQSL